MSGVQNSRIENYLGVYRNLLDDIQIMIGDRKVFRWDIGDYRTVDSKEFEADYRYIARRVANEGEHFLTVTLPRLGKWYDEVLSERNSCTPIGFKPYWTDESQNTIPRFCRTFWFVIFDPTWSPEDKARVIRLYRSLFFVLYKLETPLTKEAESAALAKWFGNERELEEFEYPDYFDPHLIHIRDIIREVFEGTDYRLFRNIWPRHGPGAVAGGEVGPEKWLTLNKIPSLHSVYPRYDMYFGFRSGGRISPTIGEQIAKIVKSSVTQEAVSRLLFVPKDSRGPRTISCEPKELMFVQQGVAQNLMNLFHSKTRGRINFVDQTINIELAKLSSVSQEYATVDMQDASDRVSLVLVDRLFPEWVMTFLNALRSTSTQLPDGSVFPNHRKFAPMGSAICFPIESLIFWAISVFACIISGYDRAEAARLVYVYGDDIIIPPRAFDNLVKVMERLALKVNISKSFTSGPFRESCGMDAYHGHQVAPFRIKKDICRRSLDAALATAVCEYSSKCFALDMYKTGEYLFNLVNSQFPGVIRHWRPLGCLSVVDPRAHWSDYAPTVKYDQRLCRCVIRAWVTSLKKRPNELTGLSRLLMSYYGHWEVHDPSQVVDLRATKIRKRNFLVDWT